MQCTSFLCVLNERNWHYDGIWPDKPLPPTLINLRPPSNTGGSWNVRSWSPSGSLSFLLQRIENGIEWMTVFDIVERGKVANWLRRRGFVYRRTTWVREKWGPVLIVGRAATSMWGTGNLMSGHGCQLVDKCESTLVDFGEKVAVRGRLFSPKITYMFHKWSEPSHLSVGAWTYLLFKPSRIKSLMSAKQQSSPRFAWLKFPGL